MVMRKLSSMELPGRKLLDVGCGFGFYLDFARAAGFRTFGIEPDMERAKAALAKGHHIKTGFLNAQSFAGERFDIVILNHVIEHTVAPIELLRNIYSILVPDGVLFMGCPNHSSLRARLEGCNYNYYSPPEHLQYFTKGSIQKALNSTGFKIVKFGTFTHKLHVKDMFAFFLRLRFMQKSPLTVQRTDEIKRFVDGNLRPLRAFVYKLILGVSCVLAPLVNKVGGDHFHIFCRK